MWQGLPRVSWGAQLLHQGDPTAMSPDGEPSGVDGGDEEDAESGWEEEENSGSREFSKGSERDLELMRAAGYGSWARGFLRGPMVSLNCWRPSRLACLRRRPPPPGPWPDLAKWSTASSKALLLLLPAGLSMCLCRTGRPLWPLKPVSATWLGVRQALLHAQEDRVAVSSR